jgi:hypothetical protein
VPKLAPDDKESCYAIELDAADEYGAICTGYTRSPAIEHINFFSRHNKCSIQQL